MPSKCRANASLSESCKLFWLFIRSIFRLLKTGEQASWAGSPLLANCLAIAGCILKFKSDQEWMVFDKKMIINWYHLFSMFSNRPRRQPVRKRVAKPDAFSANEPARMLNNAECCWHIVRCTLYDAHCKIHTVCCTLYTAAPEHRAPSTRSTKHF